MSPLKFSVKIGNNISIGGPGPTLWLRPWSQEYPRWKRCSFQFSFSVVGTWFYL